VTLGIEARREGPAVLPVVVVVLLVLAPLAAWLHLDRVPVTICLFKRLTGYPCLTCGTTRALSALAGFDLGRAFHMNPLMSALLLGIFIFGLVDLALLVRGRSLSLRLGSGEGRRLAIVAFAALLANWAYLIAAGV
jgi:hypothetical protein